MRFKHVYPANRPTDTSQFESNNHCIEQLQAPAEQYMNAILKNHPAGTYKERVQRGLSASFAGEHDFARTMFQSTLREVMLKKQSRHQIPGLAVAIGQTYLAQGQLALADAWLRRSLRISRALHNDPAQDLVVLCQVGELCVLQDKMDQFQLVFEQLQDFYLQSETTNDPALVDGLHRLAWLLIVRRHQTIGAYVSIFARFAQQQQATGCHGVKRLCMNIDLLLEQADLSIKRADYVKCRLLLRKCIRFIGESREARSKLPAVCEKVGISYLKQKQYDRARSWFARGLRVLQCLGETNSLTTLNLRVRLAETCIQLDLQSEFERHVEMIHRGYLLSESADLSCLIDALLDLSWAACTTEHESDARRLNVLVQQLLEADSAVAAH